MSKVWHRSWSFSHELWRCRCVWVRQVFSTYVRRPSWKNARGCFIPTGWVFFRAYDYFFFPVQLHYLNGWQITISPALFYSQFFFFWNLSVTVCNDKGITIQNNDKGPNFLIILVDWNTKIIASSMVQDRGSGWVLQANANECILWCSAGARGLQELQIIENECSPWCSSRERGLQELLFRALQTAEPIPG